MSTKDMAKTKPLPPKHKKPLGKLTAKSVHHGASVFQAYDFTLGLKIKDSSDLIKAIRKGIKIKSFTKLALAMNLSDKELAEVAVIPVRTLSRRKQAGHFQQDESDRLVRIATLFNDTVELFEGDHDRAAQWLQTPKRALNGVSPLQFADTAIGAQEVSDLIGRLEHGVF